MHLRAAKDVQWGMKPCYMCSAIAHTHVKYGTGVGSNLLPHSLGKHVPLNGSNNKLRGIMNVSFLLVYGGYGVGETIWCLVMIVGMHNR